MSQRVVEPVEQAQDTPRAEYNVTVDGVIAVPVNVDPKLFFDGLFDAILEFVEKFDARAALTLDQSAYLETDDELETDNGERVSQNR